MVDDLFPVLLRFHREVILPDLERVVGTSVDGLETRMNVRFDESNGHFDATYKRFDRLEIEYHMILTGLKRVEERLDRMEQRLEKAALRSELIEFKGRLDGLQEQFRALEARLDE